MFAPLDINLHNNTLYAVVAILAIVALCFYIFGRR